MGRKRKHSSALNKEANCSKMRIKSPYFTTSDDGADSNNTASVQDDARLPASFFNQPCKDLAKSILGQTLTRLLDNGERLSGNVVETEAYMGPEDSACHTYKGHRSDKVEAMYMSPGTCYVYLIYGMYNCLNISSRGDGQAVLIRALEPKDGISTMRNLRSRRRKDTAKELKVKELCSGPGKLTEALMITKAEMNQIDIATSTSLLLERSEMAIKEEDIVMCPRIGVDYATPEWVKKPLRFYIRGNTCISKRDKNAEEGS